MLRRHLFRLLLTGVVISTPAILLLPAASAAPAPSASLRLVDAWPTTATSITAYVNGQTVAALGFDQASSVLPVAAGTDTVTFTTGQTVGLPQVIRTTITIPAGSSVTVIGLGQAGGQAFLTASDNSPAPPSGQAGIRLINADLSLPPLSLQTLGKPVIAEVAPGAASPYHPWHPGLQRFIASEGAGSEALDVGATDDTLIPGSLTTFLLVGGGEEPSRLIVLHDAAGLSALPVGSVPTGLTSGAVPTAHTTSVWVLIAGIIAAFALVAGLVFGLRRRHKIRTVAALAAAVLALGGCSLTGSRSGAASPPATRSAAASSVPSRAATPAPAPAPAPTPPLLPTRISLPTLGRTAPIIPVGLDSGGALPTLASATEAAWYRGSPAPGSVGPAIIIGHINLSGVEGIFSGLADLHTGDPVIVTRSDGSSVTFAVIATAIYPKTAFPTATVYAPTALDEVRLISCTGTVFDHHYNDNIIVTAVRTA
ncbi:MAG: DUF4397 domain-containing protein [Actinomycetota bacterium]|nr:DUF4397 domain-containing protein [Actinomycetota bacterium]